MGIYRNVQLSLRKKELDLIAKFFKYLWFHLFVGIFLIVSLTFVKYSNIYHGELDVYLPHYLGNGTFINKIFNPICELDFTNSIFRGREIGSFFNLIDAYFLKLLIDNGINVFASGVFYLLVIISIYYTYQTCKTLGISDLTSKLLSLVLISTPPVMLGGMFYRTNKIVASCFLLITILTMVRNTNNKYIQSINCNNLIIFISSIIACLADEQGLAFIGIIFVYKFVNYLIANDKNGDNKKSIKPLLIALTISIVYRSYLGPLMFEKVVGIIPQSQAANFLEVGNFINFLRVLILQTRYTNMIIGNIPGGFIFQVISLLGLFYYLYKVGFYKDKLYLIISSIFPILMLIYFFNLMTLKHSAIFWPDIVSYYSLPFCFVFYSLMILVAVKLVLEGKVFERNLRLFLIAIIILNLISIPKNASLILGGHLKNFRVGVHILKAVRLDAYNSEFELNKIKLDELSPGAISLNIGRAGVTALRNKKITESF